MANVDKFYPVQGSSKFQTVSFPITKAFSIDFGAQTTAANATAAIYTFPKGSMILGFVARVREALQTGGAGTVQLGFTGTPILSSAHASGGAGLNVIISPMYAMGSSQLSSLTNQGSYTPMVLKADDTFDCILGTTGPSAGKVDVFVTYIPSPLEDLSTSDFLSVVTT
jgi:hypothetical protein